MTTGVTDRFISAQAVADAVLYEGYVLYPYRASAQKNQFRWQFGVLRPGACCGEGGTDRSFVRTECLLEPRGNAVLTVRIRFLQAQRRFVEAPGDGDAPFRRVERLEVGDDVFVEWDEAAEQSVDVGPLSLPAAKVELDEGFAFPAGTATEVVRGGDGSIKACLVRRREAVAGRARLVAEPLGLGHGLYKISVEVENITEWPRPAEGRETLRDHEEVMRRSLLGAHVMLAVDDGVFISLLDTPARCAAVAARCHSDGLYPVLIGRDDVVLSAPIILYDHPEVAAESPGDLYDATEIDEILALRVVTLTEHEKAEARGTDPRSAAIIDRCDEMAPETWARLHGTMRAYAPDAVLPSAGPHDDAVPDDAVPDDAVPWWGPAADASVNPWDDSVWVCGTEIRKGAAVRLRPSRRADAQDLFLAGLRATVAGVFKDVDGGEHVAVSVDDDPANVELAWQGRYLFFFPDEIEPYSPPQQETAEV